MGCALPICFMNHLKNLKLLAQTIAILWLAVQALQGQYAVTHRVVHIAHNQSQSMILSENNIHRTKHDTK